MEANESGVCEVFEPQTWRKTLCKNCFHTLDEHTSTPAEVDGKPSEPKKDEGDTNKKPSSTGITSKEKESSGKTNNDTKQAPSPNKPGIKTPGKTNTAALSSKFGASVSKSKDVVATKDQDISQGEDKNVGKSESSSVTASADQSKQRPSYGVGKQTTGSKVLGRNFGISFSLDKKSTTTDSKTKVNSVKENNVATSVSSVKAGQKPVESSSVSSQDSKPDNNKLSIGKSGGGRSTGAGHTNVKHLSKSFGTDDEQCSSKTDEKTLTDQNKHVTRTDSDVTSKCQSSAGVQVSGKTHVIGTQPENAVVKTVGGVSSGGKATLKDKSSVGEDARLKQDIKSPPVTIGVGRAGGGDNKVGKAEPKGKTVGKLDIPGKLEPVGKVDVKDRDKEKRLEKELLELKAKEKELIALKAKEKELLAREKEFDALKAREAELKELKTKEKELKAKEQEFKKLLAKEKELEKLKSKEKEILDKENEIKYLKAKEQELRNLKAKENEVKAKEDEIKKQEANLVGLKSKLTELEDKCKKLQAENTTLKRSSIHGKPEDMERMLEDLRAQLSSMEKRCKKLEGDNSNLVTGLKEKDDTLKRVSKGSKEMKDLKEKVQDTKKESGQVGEENSKLKGEIRDLRDEMDEMYDTFRENEVDEFRDLQKELEITGKNCRILQFKLRKAERRTDQVESDKMHYEERVRILQNQYETEDTRAHVDKVEDELQMAKDVSVRLNDELDLLEDRKGKAEEDSRHLTELLEQADKKQFRMEMEIDKLRDQVMDLKQELKYASPEKQPSNRKSSRQ